MGFCLVLRISIAKIESLPTPASSAASPLFVDVIELKKSSGIDRSGRRPRPLRRKQKGRHFCRPFHAGIKDGD
jgi:hypothetical protein